jgi:hypothetical protein
MVRMPNGAISGVSDSMHPCRGLRASCFKELQSPCHERLEVLEDAPMPGLLIEGEAVHRRMRPGDASTPPYSATRMTTLPTA